MDTYLKKVRVLFIIFFVLLVGGFSIWSFLSPKKAYSDMENRKLETLPKVTGKSIVSGSFQKKYEAYLSDQIFLRENWVRFYAQMQCFLQKKEINGVYLGKEGYLIEKYEESDFDKGLEKANTGLLADFLNASFQVLGEDHVSCLFVPSKVEVLKEKLPAYAGTDSGEGIIEQVKKKVLHENRVVDLKAALSEHEKEYIYYRTDHHWTTLGAYYGFQAYQKLNGERTPEVHSYQRETAFDDFFGTTYNKAHVRTKADEVDIFHTDSEAVRIDGNDGEFSSESFYFKNAAKKGFDRYALFFSKNTGKIIVDTEAHTGKTLLVVKDSFANCFVPFLSASYDRIIMVDCRYTKTRIGSIWKEYPEITDVLVLFNDTKFRQDTHLSVLKFRPEELEQEKTEEKPEESEDDDDSEEDFLDDLISLD